MFSIKTKIIIAYTLVFGVMLTVFAVIIYQSSKSAAFGKLDANLKSYSVSLQTEIEDELSDRSEIDVNKLRGIHPQELEHTRYQVLDIRGRKIIFDPLLSKYLQIGQEETLGKRSYFTRVKLKWHHYRVLVSPFEAENDSVYIIEVAASLHDTYSDLNSLFYLLIILIPLGLVVTGISAYFLSRAAFKPISKIVATAKKISGKNLDERLELPKAKDEVRELTEALNEMINRLDNSFKSQKRFVANASHEIRTPLTVIQTELEILEKKIENNESIETIKIALSEVEHMTKLTNSLLTIAKLDSFQSNLSLSQIRVDELLAECAQTLNQAALKKEVKINLSIYDSTEIKGDRDKLKSVFLNLLDNAVKYSRSDSTVTVILEKLSGDRIQVSVENLGPGIPYSEQSYVFNRFYRSNENRGNDDGSGLGLAIVKEIVELHNGEIDFESKMGDRTVFNVILPTGLS